jgi:hypothetical protein
MEASLQILVTIRSFYTHEKVHPTTLHSGPIYSGATVLLRDRSTRWKRLKTVIFIDAASIGTDV